MTKTIYRLYISVILLTLGLLPGCISDEPQSRQDLTEGHILEATISGDNNGTRAARATNYDYWSYVYFNNRSDVVGFYSATGNLDSPDGNGPFVNARMLYSKSRTSGNYIYGLFDPIDMDYNLDLIIADNKKTFLYFPWSPDVEDEGMELRVKASDGSTRCVDALRIQSINDNSGAIMSGRFYHSFSEVVIIRGEGFDRPPEGQEDVYVVLDQGYSHVKVVDNPYTNHSDYKLLMPVYNTGYTYDGQEMSQQDCRKWQAWRGEDFISSALKGPQPAWYVILPTTLSNGRSSVSWIEICDNQGTWHKVSSFYLLTQNDKRLTPGDRYPVEIVMENLVPTIYPYGIQPWAEVQNITDERSSGISDETAFADFIMRYNDYIASGRTDEHDLDKYGDRWDVNGEIGWHFYINDNLDMSKLPVQNYRITELRDTIDGMRNSIANIRLMNNQGFVENLTEGGCLMNTSFPGLTLTNTNATSDQVTGGLVYQQHGGLISNCTVNGNIRTRGQVGMGVGRMLGGTIKGSTFTGLIMCDGTYNNLFGVAPSTSADLRNNNFSGVVVTSYE